MLFISPQKLFSFSRYLNFCIDMQKDGLIRKTRIIQNFILSNNISRSKGNQTMKLGRLTKYNIRNQGLDYNNWPNFGCPYFLRYWQYVYNNLYINQVLKSYIQKKQDKTKNLADSSHGSFLEFKFMFNANQKLVIGNEHSLNGQASQR